MRSFRVLCASLLLLVSGSASAASATEVVEKLHATLLTVMKEGHSLTPRARADQLLPVLDETFDFTTIARVVTGRHWQNLTDAQREKFTATFRRLSAATYADNFDGYAGEKFETKGHEAKRDSEVVRTEIVESDGHRVPLTYLVSGRNEQWRIVNVIADGVSDLALKRAEYDTLIATGGIDSLIAKLEAKVASYESVRH